MSPQISYAYRLFQHLTEFYTILRRGCLFQQYIFYQYYKIELEELQYPRQNQTSLRACDYFSLSDQHGDSEQIQNEVNSMRSGRLFILPSIYSGGDRYVRQSMHDIIVSQLEQSLLSGYFSHDDLQPAVAWNQKSSASILESI